MSETNQATKTIVVAGHFAWGKGKNLYEAKKAFQGQHGRLSDGYVILTFDEYSVFEGFDMLGRYFYKGNAPAEEKVAARKRKN